jgi:hypothetical protein
LERFFGAAFFVTLRVVCVAFFGAALGALGAFSLGAAFVFGAALALGF